MAQIDEDVNYPKHYLTALADGEKLECIDLIEALGFGYCMGNALKYIWRADKKNNPIKDLKKAVYYLNRKTPS